MFSIGCSLSRSLLQVLKSQKVVVSVYEIETGCRNGGGWNGTGTPGTISACGVEGLCGIFHFPHCGANLKF